MISQQVHSAPHGKEFDMWMEQTFDWIFFAIVGLPVVYAIVDLYKQER
jgi:hypothetical protein